MRFALSSTYAGRTPAILVLVGLGLLLTFGAVAEHPKRPGKLEIIQLLQKRQFDRLEAILVGPGTPGDPNKPRRYLDFSDFEHSDPKNEQALTDWIEARPKSPSAWLARGAYYRHVAHLARGSKYSGMTPTQRFAEMERLLGRAAADYRQALRLDNRLAIAYSGLMNIAIQQGDHDAIMVIRRAGLEAVSDSIFIHSTYLWSLHPQWGGNLADLHAYLSALRDRYAKDPWSDFLKGYEEALAADVYWTRGRNEKALQFISAAIKAHETAERLSTRAGLYMAMDREDEALADIDKALSIEPDSSEYLSRKSDIYWSRKDFAKTLSLIDQAVARDPLNPRWLDKRIRLLGIVARRFRKDGDVASEREYIAKAQRDIEAAMTYGANDAGVWESISWFHVYVIKDDEKTRAALETAIILNPKNPRLWQWHLNVLFTLKDCRALDAASGYLQACRQDETCRIDTGMSNYVTEKMAWCRNGGTEPPQPKRRRGLMGMMHTCHELFEGMEKGAALEECRRRAEAGDAGAQYDMGVLSNVGKFVAKDKVAAAAWMRKAAAQGDMDAHAYLGVFNLRGIGMDQDMEKGIRMIRESAAAESLVGMNSLARSYYEGLGVEQDKEEAHRLLQIAVAKGSASAERVMKMWFGFTRY